jgi:hypothetical protein
MSDWITAREAAEILGVHKSNIPKMRRRGELTKRAGGERPAFSRREVLALRDLRAQPWARASADEPTPRRLPAPPDVEHDWLDSDAAAEAMGVTRNAVNDRAKRGRLPSVKNDGRRWFRRDHLELVKHADQVKRGVVSVGRTSAEGTHD